MRYTEGFTGKAILAMKEAIHAAEEFGTRILEVSTCFWG